MIDLLIQLGLSYAEALVVEHLLMGKTNKEIADEACISEKTVKFHLTTIFKKLKVKNRLNLALLVLRKREEMSKKYEPAPMPKEFKVENPEPTFQLPQSLLLLK